MTKSKKIYKKKDYYSGDGMLTTVWGPSMWHYLHTVSFNYPVNPSCDDKKHYKELILNMQYTLPCKHCRENLKKNLKAHPLKECHLKNRVQFSKYVYRLHEIINKMCDPLTHNAIRKQCLHQLHKPLLALKRFYISHNSRAKFLLLEREARILSHEFNPF